MRHSLISEILKFRDERDWKQFHNPKDLAISITLEAAELLENFQWSNCEEAVQNKTQDIKEELADVVMYCVLMSDVMGIDLEEAIANKLQKNREKYPVDKAYGRKDKYTVL